MVWKTGVRQRGPEAEPLVVARGKGRGRSPAPEAEQAFVVKRTALAQICIT